jgi:hypothetical protein
MPDDGLEPVGVTGRWVGLYRFRWQEFGTFPIVAELRQSDNAIAGEMYDQITQKSEYFADFVELIRKDIAIGTRREMEWMVTRFAPETVRSSRLPDTSDLEGTISGTEVRFTKSYRGAFEVTWTV